MNRDRVWKSLYIRLYSRLNNRRRCRLLCGFVAAGCLLCVDVNDETLIRTTLLHLCCTASLKLVLVPRVPRVLRVPLVPALLRVDAHISICCPACTAQHACFLVPPSLSLPLSPASSSTGGEIDCRFICQFTFFLTKRKRRIKYTFHTYIECRCTRILLLLGVAQTTLRYLERTRMRIQT